MTVVVAIIQARMGGTRLPGKVLKDIGGRTMLARVVRRARRATLVDKVVVATTCCLSAAAIVTECEQLGVRVFRGSELDVLDRYYWAAREYGAETIVRITADCPLIDPEIIDKVVGAFLEKKPDCAANTLTRAYPRGLGLSVMTMAALSRAWRETNKGYHRAHVTSYVHQHPNRFKLLAVVEDTDYSDHRWTVDTQEDLDFAREVYARLGNVDTFSWQDVLGLLALEPELMNINQHIQQKALEED